MVLFVVLKRYLFFSFEEGWFLVKCKVIYFVIEGKCKWSNIINVVFKIVYLFVLDLVFWLWNKFGVKKCVYDY